MSATVVYLKQKVPNSARIPDRIAEVALAGRNQTPAVSTSNVSSLPRVIRPHTERAVFFDGPGIAFAVASAAWISACVYLAVWALIVTGK
jgi:hypothetical protein